MKKILSLALVTLVLLYCLCGCSTIINTDSLKEDLLSDSDEIVDVYLVSQIISWDDEVITFTYDDDGKIENLIICGDSKASYSYDDENNLITVEGDINFSEKYYYDDNGNIVAIDSLDNFFGSRPWSFNREGGGSFTVDGYYYVYDENNFPTNTYAFHMSDTPTPYCLYNEHDEIAVAPKLNIYNEEPVGTYSHSYVYQREDKLDHTRYMSRGYYSYGLGGSVSGGISGTWEAYFSYHPDTNREKVRSISIYSMHTQNKYEILFDYVKISLPKSKAIKANTIQKTLFILESKKYRDYNFVE